jgi:putative endonuclease
MSFLISPFKFKINIIIPFIYKFVNIRYKDFENRFVFNDIKWIYTCTTNKGLGINLYNSNDYYKSLSVDCTHHTYENYSESKPLIQQYFSVYILKCSDSIYYAGYTSDIYTKLKQYRNGTGCTYNKTRTPVELVDTEELPDKPSALKREKQIKKLTVFDKEKLIEKSRVN